MPNLPVEVKESREKAVAAWGAFNKHATDNKIDDAEKLKTDAISQEVKDESGRLFTAAQEADTAYDETQKKHAPSIRVETARERLAFYTKAVTGRDIGFQHVGDVDQRGRLTFGQRFIESDEYKELLKGGSLKSERSSINMNRVSMAADDVISTGDGPAGALVVPQYLPGIIPLESRPLVVRDLFAQSPTSSDSISYAQQTSREGAAAPVAQVQGAASTATDADTGLKPQVSIGWERKLANVETIAAWMATTRQSMQDAGQMASLIDNQLRLMVTLAEEDQLVAGSGTSPDLLGITVTPGVQTLVLSGTDDGINLDGIRDAKRMVQVGASRLAADSIIVNPNDAMMIDLLKDDTKNYRGGNPIGNFTFNQPIWSLKRVESEAIDEGTALVGAFKAGATVYEREAMAIYTTDSHSDFFVKNLLAILAEERLGLATFFPSAFVLITFTDWTEFSSGDEGVVS